MSFPSSRRGRVLGSGLLLLAAIVSLSCGFFLLFSSARAGAALPITPLGELHQHAGDKKLVRARARLVSDPAAISAEGQELALQRVQVVDGEQKVLYDETAPAALWISDGKTTLALDPGDFDTDLVDIAATEKIANKGELPASIQAVLLSDFDDVPTPVDATVRVWNIEQGAQVTIIGTVEREDDAPIIVAPDEETPYIISPLSDDEIASRLGALSPMTRALSWGLVLLGVLLGGASWKKRRPTAPVSVSPLP